jgi:hypothetical protein
VFGDVVKTVADAADGTGNVWKNGVVDTIDDKISRRQFENELAVRCPSCYDAMNGNRGYSIEEMQDMGGVIMETARANGVEINGVVFYASNADGRNGFYYEDGKIVALNLFDGNGNFLSAEKGVYTIHHEFTHPRTKDEDHAKYMGEFGLSAHNLVNALHGLNFSDTSRHDPIKWLAANAQSPSFQAGNQFAARHPASETLNDTGQIYRNIDKIKTLAGGSEEKLARLIAAECAITECSAQFPLDSKEYKFYAKLEDRGFSPELAEERRLMIELGLDYDDSDFERDTFLRTEATYAPVTRLLGLGQTVGGTFAYAGGFATGNAWLFAWGMDQAYAGSYTAVWGVPSRTVTGTLISETFGLSAGEGELLAGFAGGAAAYKAPGAFSGPLSGADDFIRVGTAEVAGAKGGVAFTPTEMNALREAGLSNAEVLRHVELNGDLYFFRGTSVGWPGSPGAQATAVSATTDPYVATVFALESRAQGGQAALLYGGQSKFGAFDMGNWMAMQEREVGVLLSPKAFAAKAPHSISPDVARQALHDMGLPPLPYSVQTPSMRSTLLDAAPKMTPEQVNEFLRRVGH